jgi:hypothetical protein
MYICISKSSCHDSIPHIVVSITSWLFEQHDGNPKRGRNWLPFASPWIQPRVFLGSVCSFLAFCVVLYALLNLYLYIYAYISKNSITNPNMAFHVILLWYFLQVYDGPSSSYTLLVRSSGSIRQSPVRIKGNCSWRPHFHVPFSGLHLQVWQYYFLLL